MCDGSGKVTLTDFHFEYNTSLKSFNQKNEHNLAYVCFVTGNTLNLTPLGKFVMPPPMSEKKVELEGFPVLIDMFGHQICVMLASGKILMTNCMETDKIVTLQLSENIDSFTVTKMKVYRMKSDEPWKLIIVRNIDDYDEILVFTIDGKGEAKLSHKSKVD